MRLAALVDLPLMSVSPAYLSQQTLRGGCQLPIAGFAELSADHLKLRALVGYPDGSKICHSEKQGSKQRPTQLGQLVAADLTAQGADKILASMS